MRPASTTSRIERDRPPPVRPAPGERARPGHPTPVAACTESVVRCGERTEGVVQCTRTLLALVLVAAAGRAVVVGHDDDHACRVASLMPSKRGSTRMPKVVGDGAGRGLLVGARRGSRRVVVRDDAVRVVADLDDVPAVRLQVVGGLGGEALDRAVVVAPAPARTSSGSPLPSPPGGAAVAGAGGRRGGGRRAWTEDDGGRRVGVVGRARTTAGPLPGASPGARTGADGRACRRRRLSPLPPNTVIRPMTRATAARPSSATPASLPARVEPESGRGHCRSAPSLGAAARAAGRYRSLRNRLTSIGSASSAALLSISRLTSW